MNNPPFNTGPSLGKYRLIGQEQLRSRLWHISNDNRLSHAYLISGQPGIGKKALALAFAEAINGVENLGPTPEKNKSNRRSWFFHPDIHLFLPLPSNVTTDELRARLELLANDPYDIVDFALRPSLTTQGDSKNRRAFYSTDYFKSEIRPVTHLKPREGKRNIVIISQIEKMRAEVANSFLKLLEEPGEKVMFLLTTDHINALLPTIISRCQILSCQNLSSEEIYGGLIEYDKIPKDQALFLSRIAGGNYSVTRFYDPETLQEKREDIIHFLRISFKVDAGAILDISQKWASEYNKESQIAILAMIETFLRDIALYRSGADEELITNNDRLEVIQNFSNHLQNARIDDMIKTLQEAHTLLLQNVNPRMLFTVIANRFASWMRGLDTILPSKEAWRHLPALSDAEEAQKYL